MTYYKFVKNPHFLHVFLGAVEDTGAYSLGFNNLVKFKLWSLIKLELPHFNLSTNNPTK